MTCPPPSISLHRSDFNPRGGVRELFELGVLPVVLRDVLVRVKEMLPHPLLRVERLSAHRTVGDGGVIVDGVDVFF